MSDKKSDADKEAEFMLKMLDLNGVAVAVVSDGYVILLKRDKLQEILDKQPNSQSIRLFIKTSKFQN